LWKIKSALILLMHGTNMKITNSSSYMCVCVCFTVRKLTLVKVEGEGFLCRK
jgi:hypothetical protein